MSDELDARRAEGIVHALTDRDTTACSDCGREIDVSEAETPMEVVIVLEQHRNAHHTEVSQ